MTAAIVLAATVAGLAWRVHQRDTDPRRATRPFRVGFQDSPPHQFVTIHGQPTGPAVEVFSEASRQLGIPIEWVYAPEGPEPALLSGKVDLWPLVGDLPERRKLFYISDPWLAISYWMVTVEASPIRRPADTFGKVVAVGTSNLDARLAATSFPGAHFLRDEKPSAGLEAICAGTADAALVSGGNAFSEELRAVKSCGDHQFNFVALPNGRLSFGIPASPLRPGADRAADTIRDQIGKLAADGELSSIYFKWSMNPNNEVLVVQYLADAQRRNRYLASLLGVLFVALALVVWQTHRLHAARQLAEHANTAKGQFLANMSHEIRTPMNGVIGMTELAMEAESREEQREYLSMVKLSGNALLTVINDILDFSKIEAGKLALDPVDFSLRDTVAQAMKTLMTRVAEKPVALRFDLAGDVPPRLVGDPGRLRQVILNIAGNALKFTARGEVALRATLLESTAESATVQFSVRDTGIGIAPAQQASVFNAFSQADGSTTRRYGGTGLGLTISKQLVSMMGGRIWLESELGRGTVVYFTAVFGAAETPAQDSPLASDPAPAGATAATATRTWNVLVAEDNPVNQTLVRRLLQKQGHKITIVGNGRAAVDACQHDRYDVILMDIQMPEMDGLAATATIRSLEHRFQRARVPIIALTAHAMSGDREKCLRSEMDGYVTKPIDAKALFAEIAQVCRQTTL